MTRPKKPAAPAPLPPLRTTCACCDATVQIHLGAKVYLHDFHQGEPYSPTVLPLRSQGDRAIVCLACAHDAEKIAKAGLRFVEQALREAKKSIIEENTEPEQEILTDFLKDHRYEPGAFLEFWGRRIADTGADVGDPNDDEIAAFDEAQLLKHYPVALALFEDEESEGDRRRRLALSGLRVVSSEPASK